MGKIKNFISTLVVTSFCFTGVIAQSTIQKKLDTYCGSNAKLSYSQVGISVKDLQTDSVIASVDANKTMLPASLVKMYTTSAALAKLQPDFKFKTVIGYSGEINNKGVLKGNLVVYGGGDPTLGSKFFPQTKGFVDTIVQAIKNKGITSIDGYIILDCSMYGKEVIPQSWIWEDFGKDYASGVFPISMYDNTFQITLQSGAAGDSVQIKQVLPAQMATSITTDVTSNSGSNSEPSIQGNPEELTRVVTGSVPANRSAYTVRGAMPSPPNVFGLELKQALYRSNMCNYDQEYVIKFDPYYDSTLDTILVLQSPELNLIVGVTNYYSNNSYAEHLVKYLGYAVNRKGTYESGTQVVKNYFEEIGVTAKGVNLYDGSGLSRLNTTTANHMTDFLVKEYKVGADSSYFYRSLPVSGKYGTLRSYEFPSYMIGKINGKTGSMSRVKNMAGYMTTKSGKRVAFCVMINGFLDEDGDMKAQMLDILDTIYANY